MSQAVLEVRVGGIEFRGEGDGEWVATQFEKLLESVPGLLEVAPPALDKAEFNGGGSATPPGVPAAPSGGPVGGSELGAMPLPSFLKKVNAVRSQNDRFLGTAIWLQLRGKNRMLSGDVSRALSDSNLSKLSNPSDTLSQNISKGFCERDGKQFFVTEEGMRYLGVVTG